MAGDGESHKKKKSKMLDEENGEVIAKMKKKEKKEKKVKKEKKEKKEKKSKKEKKQKKEKKKDKKRKIGKIADGSSSSSSSSSGASSPSKKSKVAVVEKVEPKNVEEYRKANKVTVTGSSLQPYMSFETARKGFAGDAVQPLNVCCKTFTKPSPIQAEAWPIVLSGKDMVGVAQTGSGKTLAFLLPGIARMLDGHYGQGAFSRPRALVLAPTRELAMQSAKVAEQACTACDQLAAIVIFGGQPKWEQRKKIEQTGTLDIVVATPGRLLDFVNDKVLDLSNVHYLVLDEADRMLDMGFEKDVKQIISLTVPASKGRQTVMFSATWPREIRELASSFMNNPAKVVIGSDKLSASTSVKQHVEVVAQHDKEGKLLSLLRKLHNGKNRVIVFALYKKEAARIENLLARNNYKVMGVHGDKAQSAREEAVRQFDKGNAPILVATDVASRGLDIKGVEYVINVSFPLTVEDYVHRIGRTGRAGATGEAYTFFTQQDKHLAGALQNVLRQAGEEIPPELARFGNTVKKKEHKLYGSHFRDIDPTTMKKPTHITFSDDSDDDE